METKACKWCKRRLVNTHVLENGYHRFCYIRKQALTERPYLRQSQRVYVVPKATRLRREWKSASQESNKHILEKYGSKIVK